MNTYNEEFCRKCGELLDENKVCQSCAPIVISNTRSLTIHRDGYTITQASNHHVSVIDDANNRLVLHAQCTERMTVSELEAYWKNAKRMLFGDKR